jgi:uncharacterized protein
LLRKHDRVTFYGLSCHTNLQICTMVLEVSGEEFELLPQKGIYWKKINALLLADLHIGKINHFRKSGVPLPVRANERNIELLIDLLHKYKPARVIFLGDLFHSYYNPEWEVFGEVVKHFKSVVFELVIGNHDVMSDIQYERKGIRVYDQLLINNIMLTHHPMETKSDAYYNLAGHIHPGAHLFGKGKQGITLPCFYFGAWQGLLPAFGVFTGLARITPQRDDKVFVIANDKIIDVAPLTKA